MKHHAYRLDDLHRQPDEKLIDFYRRAVTSMTEAALGDWEVIHVDRVDDSIAILFRRPKA